MLLRWAIVASQATASRATGWSGSWLSAHVRLNPAWTAGFCGLCGFEVLRALAGLAALGTVVGGPGASARYAPPRQPRFKVRPRWRARGASQSHRDRRTRSVEHTS